VCESSTLPVAALAQWAPPAASVAWPLALYAVLVAVAVHLRIVLHETPWLARTSGDA
jgi:hypothetical protein